MGTGPLRPCGRLFVCATLLGGLSACGAEDNSPAEPTHFSSRSISGVALAPDGLTIRVGDTLQMKASTLPPTPVVWQWSVVPNYAAQVDQQGLVRGLRPGSAEIHACADVPYRVCGRAPLLVQ